MLTHEEALEKVCCICLNRNGVKADRKVVAGSKLETSVRAHVDPTYSASDPNYARGTCGDCRCRLYDHTAGKEKARPLLIPVDIELNLPGRVTRQKADQSCQCHFCWLAKLNGGEWNRVKLQFSLERQKLRGRSKQEQVGGVAPAWLPYTEVPIILLRSARAREACLKTWTKPWTSVSGSS